MIQRLLSSLFKATRRTIVAEMTLMIVIVISFSWSAYALYKLFAGGSETLFGYSFANAPPTESDRVRELKINNNTIQANTHSDITRTKPSDQMNLADIESQLANYKSQIVSELLARQQRLVNDAAGRGQVLLSSLSGQPNHRSSIDPYERGRQPVDLEELQQWKGGYKLPTSLDYLFETRRQPAKSTSDINYEQADRVPLSTINSHAAVAINSNNKLPPRQHSLVHLSEEAPSLMQLSPSALPSVNEAFEQTVITTTEAPSSDERAADDQIVSTTTSTTPAPPSQVSADETAETTTIEPSPQADDSEEQDEIMPSTDDGDAEAGESQPNGEDKNTDSERDDRVADERVKQASRSIDEDVDRMTQPSLGMASRTDNPLHSYKSAVQFDDSPPETRPSSFRDPLGKIQPGSSGRDQQLSKDRESSDVDRGNWVGGDLLVADNRHKSPVSTSPRIDQGQETIQRSMPRHRMRSNKVAIKSIDQAKPFGHRLSSPSHVADPKRKLPDFDGTRAQLKRSRRWALHSREPRGHGQKIRRRSDEDTDEEDDDGEGESENNSAHDQVQESQGSGSDSATAKTSGPSLEDLLAHKQLLDALQTSRLPGPVMSGPSAQSGNKTLLRQHTRHHATRPSQSSDSDHQSADTQYSVDHGLLLYPASDEEHMHKSTSHKSGKSSKKKGKKKVTLAVKKGGHKNKKHKKEEKKYIKEKKFKGAKKGKKMSKGKGGKGGKKGKKFYKDKGFKKKGFKNIYVKNEFGQKKSYFDEFRDKDFKKKWKNFDDKYNYAQMKKWQAKDVKGAKKMKDHGEHHKKYDKGKWKKNYSKHMESEMAKKKKKASDDF